MPERFLISANVRGLRIPPKLRHSFAAREDKTDLSVMSDYTLYDICAKLPRNDEDFRGIYGIGEFKSQKYAAAFIAEVSSRGNQ